MIPVIALVGRPNVGKSTLFNRLTRSRDALVANFSGLTRDRQYGSGNLEGRPFKVIDTAGITGDEEGVDAAMAEQSHQAIREADAVVFMFDGRAGLTGADQQFVQELRGIDKPIYFAVNKVDGVDQNLVLAEFYSTGLERFYPMTATHGKGVRQLLQTILDDIAPLVEVEPQLDEETGELLPVMILPEEEKAPEGIKIAIIGRPNVGKSTLVNRLLGEERVVVYDMPGTTRDSIYIPFEREGNHYVLIDTAGVRRRKNVKETVEKFSIVKTMKAMEDANVVVLVMDAQEGLVDQDLHLLGYAIEQGRALVLAFNKWDGLDAEHKAQIKADLERRLRFIDYAKVHTISALHGTGVGHLYDSIHEAYEAATQPLHTSRLTRILEDAIADHQPPTINGRRIKLRYAHAGGQNPPLIVIHGNQTDKVPESYTRYLEKVYRRELGLEGTPVRIEYRSSDNPFAGKKNKLTDRQVNRKKRLMKFVKKNSKKSKRG